METYQKTKSHQDYQDYLHSFKKAPGKSARQNLKCNNPQRAISSAGSLNSLPFPSLPTDDRPQMQCKNALANALFELRRFKMEYVDVQPYSPHNLPAEEMCKRAIGSLIEGTGSVMHFFSVSAATKVISRAYHSTSKPDNLTVSELCVAAAVGAQLDTAIIPKQVVRKLFASTYMLLDNVDMDESSYLRVMRILLCLSTYSVMEKHLGARAFISKSTILTRKSKNANCRYSCWVEHWQMAVPEDFI